MKIFGIGLTRTGTTSLTQALKMLGYSSIHCPHSYAQIHYHDASTDTPVAARFPILDHKYPNSKFILTTRNKDTWIDSAASLTRNKHDLLWKLEGRLTLWKSLIFDREKFLTGYDVHHKFVMDYFHDRPEDLLILPIEQENKWDVLCSFLNKDIPQYEYPHLNRRFGQ